MNPLDAFDRIVASLHQAMLDDAHWPAATALIDQAVGSRSNGLGVSGGFGDDARVYFAGFYRRGERRQDLERQYFEDYFAIDERVPRLQAVSAGKLIHVPDLYNEKELKSSVAYNEGLRRLGVHEGLNVRFDRPDVLRVFWALGNPVTAGGWQSAQLRLARHLMPHVRQFVFVRQALVAADALGAGLGGLLTLVFAFALGVAGCGSGGENGDMGEGGDDTPFVSSGTVRGEFDGVAEALTLEYDETFAGLLGDTEIAATFDEASEAFVGRVRNEASEAVCDVGVALVLDPGTANERVVEEASPGEPLQIDGLRSGSRHGFTLPAPGMSFSQWTVQVETFTCASAPAGGASSEGSEGGEGSAEHGAAGEGSEGGEHGGGEGSEGGGEGSEGGESGEEANPSIPIGDSYAGVNAGQTFDFGYEADTGLFRGTVENTSASLVCASRTEIHLGTPSGVVELGPTIPEDLEPGDVLYVVMYQDGPEPQTCILHPEASACP